MDKTIVKQLQQIKYDISNGTIATSGQLAERLKKAFDISTAHLNIPKIVSSEPPMSNKFNAIASAIENSIADRGYAFDILAAAAMYDYDVAMSMLASLEGKVMGLADAVKTLYFFSEPTRAGVYVISNDFRNGWGIFTSPENTLYRDSATGIMLPIIEKKIAKVDIEIDGNGVPGNYYVVENGSLAASNNSFSKQENITDGEPTTRYEYERFRIKASDYRTTKGYGFGFSDTELKWGHPEVSEVHTDVKLTMKTPIVTNYAVVNPGSQEDNFTIESVTLTRADGSTKTMSPQNLVITPELYMHGEREYVNYAAFLYEPTTTVSALFKMIDTKPKDCVARHHYEVDEEGERIPGESPPLDNPHSLFNIPSANDRNFKSEDLIAERFSIGVKDIILQQITFAKSGVVESIPVKFGKEIDRVALEVDYDLTNKAELDFLISFDGGTDWHRISPLGASLSGQVIAVNSMTPEEYRDPSTRYIVKDNKPKEFMIRIIMRRVVGDAFITPMVRSMRLEVTLK